MQSWFLLTAFYILYDKLINPPSPIVKYPLCDFVFNRPNIFLMFILKQLKILLNLFNNIKNNKNKI